MSAIIPIHLYFATGNINICPGVNEPNPRPNKQKFASLHLLITINIRNFRSADTQLALALERFFFKLRCRNSLRFVALSEF